MATHLKLSRREREIVDILYRRREASAAEVRGSMDRPPSYSAVRALLRLLEEKGHIKHRQEGRKYIYSPKVNPRRARRSALRHLVKTFFSGSAEQCVAAIIDMEGRSFSEMELDRLADLIESARKKGQQEADHDGAHSKRRSLG